MSTRLLFIILLKFRICVSLPKRCENGSDDGSSTRPTRVAAGMAAWWMASVTAALLLVPARPAYAADQVVYPTGVYPADVQFVQAAVDQGGRVLLKATDFGRNPLAFNFGPAVVGSGRVLLTRDVTIIGERSATGAITTVRGGSLPFLGRAATKTVIRGIVFDGPLRGAMWFLGPPEADTEVVDNTVRNVVGRLIGCCSTTAEAILVQGGRVRIADNIVHNIDADSGIGISQFRSSGPVEISGNRISGTPLIGIESTANQGVVRIVDNVLRPGQPRSPDGCCGRGIEINGTGAYVVARNDIVVASSLGGDGILAFGATQFGFGPLNGARIERNVIRLRPTEVGPDLFNSGVSLGGIAFNNLIANNEIKGNAYVALDLFDTQSFEPTSEVAFTKVLFNDLEDVRSVFADLFLEAVTHDTVAKGQFGTVIDEGTNNHIQGSTRDGRVDARSSSKRADRRGEALRQAHGHSHAWSAADIEN